MTGPYNTPIALAREPMTAAFMVLCAPLLIQLIWFELAGVLIPGLALPEGAPLTRDYIGLVTLIACVGVALHFALMSVWSNLLGAGPFAGEMRASMKWIWIALLVGPAILIGPSLLANLAMSGQEGWVYADNYDKAWEARENRTLATVFYGILLAPVVEEVTYRGVAVGALLARGVNPVATSVLASAVFASIHWQYSPMAIAVVFVAGLGFSALRIASGTVMVPIIAHIAANCVVFLS